MCRLSQKQICRIYVEQILSEGNIDFLETVIARTFVENNPGAPEVIRGRDAVRQRLSRTKKAFPNGIFEIQDIIEEGDRVVVRYTFTGTPDEPITSLGQRGQGIEIYRLHEGQIVESWVHGAYPGSI